MFDVWALLDNDIRFGSYIIGSMLVAIGAVALIDRKIAKGKATMPKQDETPKHEELTALMALRIQNDGFGPCTCLFEAFTLEEMLADYTEACRDAEARGEAMTVDGWAASMLRTERNDNEGMGLPPKDIGLRCARIAMSCSIIMQTPENALEFDPDGAEAKAREMVPAPNPIYLIDL